MIKRNGGCCYTTKMFEAAKKDIKTEMEQLQKENPKMTAKEARYKAERSNKFTNGSRDAVIVGADTGVNVGVAAGAGAGASAGLGAGIGIEVAVGAGIGAIGGPVGAAIGGLAGGFVGLAVDSIVKSVTLKRKLNNCVTQ